MYVLTSSTVSRGETCTTIDVPIKVSINSSISGLEIFCLPLDASTASISTRKIKFFLEELCHKTNIKTYHLKQKQKSKMCKSKANLAYLAAVMVTQLMAMVLA